MAAHFEGSSSTNVAGSSTTIRAPSGILDGDLMVLLVAGSAALACTTPSGWTAGNPAYVTSNKLFMFYRVAASEPATYTLATSGSNSVTMLGYWRAADPAVLDVKSAAAGTGNSTTITAPGVTTTVDGDQILFLAGSAGASAAYTAPSGYTSQATGHGSPLSTFSVYMADATQASAGAIADTAATLSPSGNWNSFLFAVEALAGVSVNSLAPSITGATDQGSTLTCDPGTWDASPLSYEYQWTRNGVTTYTSTSGTYDTILADRGQTVSCKVSARNAAGLAGSVAASNSIDVTVPSVPDLGILAYSPPPQTAPITIDLSATGDTDYFATLTTGADYIITLSPTVPRTGLIEVNANGANSVMIVGGLWALNDGGTKNYHIHLHNLAGWAWIEGQEADMSATHADFISIAGSTNSQPGPYQPDVYIMNCRAVNLTADNSTNHADIYQPQGKIHNVFIDKLTFSSNYDGLTIATDGSDGNTPPPPIGIVLSRVNAWYSAANAALPTTQFFWLNNANGVTNKDTAPFLFTFDDVWVDLVRGYGRSNFDGKISTTIFPSVNNTGAGLAGGGNLVTGNGPSPFTHGELIGAQDAADKSYAYISNPKMTVTGLLWSGSPDTDRDDVAIDADGSGSFVPVGIGTNYVSPGYTPSVTLDIEALFNQRDRDGGKIFLIAGSAATIDIEALWNQKYRDSSVPFPLGGVNATLNIEELWNQHWRDSSVPFVIPVG